MRNDKMRQVTNLQIMVCISSLVPVMLWDDISYNFINYKWWNPVILFIGVPIFFLSFLVFFGIWKLIILFIVTWIFFAAELDILLSYEVIQPLKEYFKKHDKR